MFDIITFGSATSDIFLKLNRGNFRLAQKGLYGEGRGLCFLLGSKLLVNDTAVFSGGGGTNTACTFANLGFRTAYVGKIGTDTMADVVLNDLKKYKVFADFVKKDTQTKTALSVILSSTKERTIFIYKGACHFLEKKDVPWAKIKKTKWFYLAPLYYQTAELLDEIVKFARENKISVAFNPSRQHLKMGKQGIGTILALIDVLILNMSEASLLTGISKNDEIKILKELRYMCPGIIVITKGNKGVLVCDGKSVFNALASPEIKVQEKTGAGDAFGSAFTAGLLEKNNVEYAIQMGIANSESCIQEIGAKNGLLKKGARVNVEKYKITKSIL
ncbi:MAG: carbohydrate kinase family protein [Parcubacteria group bacterium]|nr:carbohydrate kinase family protein [Parcubacteria group bacterium]